MGVGRRGRGVGGVGVGVVVGMHSWRCWGWWWKVYETGEEGVSIKERRNGD